MTKNVKSNFGDINLRRLDKEKKNNTDAIDKLPNEFRRAFKSNHATPVAMDDRMIRDFFMGKDY